MEFARTVEQHVARVAHRARGDAGQRQLGGVSRRDMTPACQAQSDRSSRDEPAWRGPNGDSSRLLTPDNSLRRGLAQMPPQSAMEWLIKRIAATPSNDALLAGL